MGNKLDLADSLNISSPLKISPEQLKSLSKELQLSGAFSVSAKTRENINQAFNEIIKITCQAKNIPVPQELKQVTHQTPRARAGVFSTGKKEGIVAVSNLQASKPPAGRPASSRKCLC